MIEEQILPREPKLMVRIRAAENRSQRRIFFRIEHQFFIMANALLRIRLRREDAAVIFEIEFILPRRDFEIGKLLRQIGEKFSRCAELNLREYGVRIAKAIRFIEHGSSRAAAMVADSVQVKHLRRVLILAEPAPVN